MKFVQLLRMSIIAVVAVFSFHGAHAQSPNEQVGVGITGGNFLGGHVAYAINPGFHIGTQFGFQVQSVNSTSTTMLALAPYAKFILKGSPQFKPFGKVYFGLASGSTSVSNIKVSQTKTSIGIDAGAEYFLNKNFGIYGGFNFLDLAFGDVEYTYVGIGQPFLGVEWFFD